MVTRVRGAQIKDESIESADIASGSIKAGELNAEAVTGQTVLTSGLDLNNDRFLVWDADANSLKQMPPVVFSAAMGSGGAGSSSPYFFPMGSEGFNEQIFTTGSFGFSNPVSVPKVIGTDVFFYVSGSRGKMGTAVTGSIVLGGDTMVSGSVYIDGVESASDETFIQFTEDGGERAKIGVNTSNNIIIHNQYTNKHIVFKVNDAGVTREGLRINGAVPEVVVNESSTSLVDFRVESDSNTHMLFVDGGNNKVGVGTDQPSTTLHAYANVSNAYVATVDNDQGSAGHGLKVTSDGTGSGTYLLDLEAASTTKFRVRGDGRVGIGKVTSLPAAILTVSSSNTDSDLAIAHKIHHIGDSDTFMSFEVNEIGLSAGGLELLSIDGGNAKVGIGALGPSTMLEVEDIRGPQLRITNSSQKNVDFNASGAGDLSVTGSNTNPNYIFHGISNTTLIVNSTGASTSDATIAFSVDNLASLPWAMGCDNSDGDKFKIGQSTIEANTCLLYTSPSPRDS